MGGVELSVDSCKSSDSGDEYSLSWITGGYLPTKSGSRTDLAIVYHFDNGQVTHKIQAKFYSPDKGSHLTWGTPVTKMELAVKGLNPVKPGDASPYQNLVPSKVQYK